MARQVHQCPRAETVHKLPAFRAAFKRRRCLAARRWVVRMAARRSRETAVFHQRGGRRASDLRGTVGALGGAGRAEGDLHHRDDRRDHQRSRTSTPGSQVSSDREDFDAWLDRSDTSTGAASACARADAIRGAIRPVAGLATGELLTQRGTGPGAAAGGVGTKPQGQSPPA